MKVEGQRHGKGDVPLSFLFTSTFKVLLVCLPRHLRSRLLVVACHGHERHLKDGSESSLVVCCIKMMSACKQIQFLFL